MSLQPVAQCLLRYCGMDAIGGLARELCSYMQQLQVPCRGRCERSRQGQSKTLSKTKHIPEPSLQVQTSALQERRPKHQGSTAKNPHERLSRSRHRLRKLLILNQIKIVLCVQVWQAGSLQRGRGLVRAARQRVARPRLDFPAPNSKLTMQPSDCCQVPCSAVSTQKLQKTSRRPNASPARCLPLLDAPLAVSACKGLRTRPAARTRPAPAGFCRGPAPCAARRSNTRSPSW